jgi:UDP-2,3-diacylglucosamine pyrophosphatase LpxH
MNTKRKVEVVVISDVHLGTYGSRANDLVNYLRSIQPEILILNGDIIDIWQFSKHYFPQDHMQVLKEITSMLSQKTKVYYITGNHDDFLRHYAPLDLGENIQIVDEYEWNNYFITHGDKYDGIVNLKWLGILGSVGYELAIRVDRTMKKLGYKKSLSKWAKDKVKDAVKFITLFEDQLVYQAKKRKCVGVICGHIHKPESKTIDGIHYLNCGDWIENNSYIIYNKHEFKVKNYKP